MAQDSYVQLPADSTGKKVRNIQATVIQGDGSTSVVQMQVVSLVDSDGKAVNLDLYEQLEHLIRIGRQQRFLLRMLVNETLDNGKVSDADIRNAGDFFL